MLFYNAQWYEEGKIQFGELRDTREEAIADLAAMGAPIDSLVFDSDRFGIGYIPNTGFGIAVCHV